MLKTPDTAFEKAVLDVVSIHTTAPASFTNGTLFVRCCTHMDARRIQHLLEVAFAFRARNGVVLFQIGPMDRNLTAEYAFDFT
jgi:hypothetical protein